MRQGMVIAVFGVVLLGSALASTPQPGPQREQSGTRPPDHRVLKGHGSVVYCVVFSPDGKMLASASPSFGDKDRARIILWDVASGKARTRLTPPNVLAPLALAFSPDGRTLAWGDWEPGADPDPIGLNIDEPSVVKFFDLASSKIRIGCGGHRNYLITLAFSPDGKILATASMDGHPVKLWNVDTGKKRATLRGHGRALHVAKFSPDGKMLASTGYANELWEVATGGLRVSMQGRNGGYPSLAFHPGGRLLASGSADDTVRLWDVGTGKTLRVLKGKGREICDLAFDPTGKMLAAGHNGGGLTLWSVDESKVVRSLNGHTRDVLSVAFSPDGQTLASGSADRTVRLWDLSRFTTPARARPAAPRATGTR